MKRRGRDVELVVDENKPAATGGTTGGDLRTTVGILVALGIALVGIDRKVAHLRDEVNLLDTRSTMVLGRTERGMAALGVDGPPLGELAGYRLTAHGDEHDRMTIDDLAAHLLDVHGLDPNTRCEGWPQLHELHQQTAPAEPLRQVEG